MTGKEFLDQEYGQPRGNGYGIAKILDKFGEIKKQEVLSDISDDIRAMLDRVNDGFAEELIKRMIEKHNL